jgi:3-isopropylmalate dehydratase small subunit
MEPFTRLTSIAAPLEDANVDTDIILPARFLLITEKAGLGRYAFFERRYNPEGQPRPDFVLNQPAFADAKILLAGPNFGCGSSREQAPWALRDLGLRCIIAPSFGEIFAANCFKNGILPVSLPDTAPLVEDATNGRPITVDLGAGEIVRANGEVIRFVVEDWRREALLNGWDEVDTIRSIHAAAIERFEAGQRQSQPWLWTNG